MTAAWDGSDAATRERLRVAVAELARWSKLDPEVVAQRAAELARAHPDRSARLADVSAYLLAEGRPELERALGCGPPVRVRMVRFVRRHAAGMFLGAIGVMVAALLAAEALGLARAGLPTWEIAVALVVTWPLVHGFGRHQCENLVVLALPVQPELPKLDFAGGIPPEHKTLVVHAVIVHDLAGIDELLATVEANYIGNRDPMLTYCVVTDVPDARTEERDEDAPLLRAMTAGIERLNRRFGTARFQHFHRRRRFNERAGVWMGWERKRGKLVEFNRLVLGHDDTSFDPQYGDCSVVRGARHIITLDADSIMFPHTAARLVGTIAHPLNRPRFDDARGRVVAGYTLIQPACVLRPWGNTRLSRLLSLMQGLSVPPAPMPIPVLRLFDDGLFYGKGIYDVAAFERSIDGLIPENWVLSHDKLEGRLARATEATEIIVLEGAPTHIQSFFTRLHRWSRGDTQVLPWALPWVPTAAGWARSRLSWLDRYRGFSDFAFMLRHPALATTLCAAWLGVVPGGELAWTALAIAAYTPQLVNLLVMIPRRMVRRGPLFRLVFWLLVLPALTVVTLDAIARAAYRMTPRGRGRALEWTTAAMAERERRGMMMLGIPAFGVVVAVVVALLHPAGLVAALPFVVAWLVAPAIVRRLDQPERTETTTPEDEAVATRLVRFCQVLGVAIEDVR